MRIYFIFMAALSLVAATEANAQTTDIRNKTVIATGQGVVNYAYIAPSERVFLGGYRASVGSSAKESATGSEYQIGKTIQSTALQYTVAGKALKCVVTTNAQLAGNVLTLTVVSIHCPGSQTSYSNTIEFDGDTCKWRLEVRGEQVVKSSCKVIAGRQLP